jgi:hypothetical protein
MQDRRVQGVNRPCPIELEKVAGFDPPAAIPQKDERPGSGIRVLFVSITAGVDNECVVHHRSVAFRHGFEGPHQLQQHLAVIVPDLVPDEISFLLHVS